ncbi:hypothetical protein V6N13_128200 [Hibiscus sabdariffa]|uniref:Uncharacterized protein n=1 Tax=Hibiscus sabdariffa TaxID=183260 RepID=A0ABR1ZS58_9ROSI
MSLLGPIKSQVQPQHDVQFLPAQMSTQIPASFSLQPVSSVPVYRPASKVYTNEALPSSVSPHAFMVTPETPSAFVATPEMVDDNAWYPDSGATHYLTKDASNLQPTTAFQGSG